MRPQLTHLFGLQQVQLRPQLVRGTFPASAHAQLLYIFRVWGQDPDDGLWSYHVRTIVQFAPMWVPRRVLLKQYPMYLAWHEEEHGKPTPEVTMLLLLAQKRGTLPLTKDVLLHVLNKW